MVLSASEDRMIVVWSILTCYRTMTESIIRNTALGIVRYADSWLAVKRDISTRLTVRMQTTIGLQQTRRHRILLRQSYVIPVKNTVDNMLLTAISSCSNSQHTCSYRKGGRPGVGLYHSMVYTQQSGALQPRPLLEYWVGRGWAMLGVAYWRCWLLKLHGILRCRMTTLFCYNLDLWHFYSASA